MNAGRSNDGDLIAPGQSQRAQDRLPAPLPDYSPLGCDGEQALTMTLSKSGKHRNVDAHARGRNHAEIGERRITPADTGQSEEDAPEFVLLGDLLHLRSRIRDGDEAASVAAGALEEILLEDVRLERRSGFAGDDEQRARQVHAALDRENLRRVGGIEDVQLGKSVALAERRVRGLRGTGSTRPSPAKGCA